MAWVIAHETYLHGGQWNNDTVNGYSAMTEGTLDWNNTVGMGGAFGMVSYIHNNYIDNPSAYANISNYECIMASMNPLRWRPNTILISFDPANATGNFDANSSILDYGTSFLNSPDILDADGLCRFNSYNRGGLLPCNDFTSANHSIVDNWQYKGASIQYCLVETGGTIKNITELCYLQCTPSMMLGM